MLVIVVRLTRQACCHRVALCPSRNGEGEQSRISGQGELHRCDKIGLEQHRKFPAELFRPWNRCRHFTQVLCSGVIAALVSVNNMANIEHRAAALSARCATTFRRLGPITCYCEKKSIRQIQGISFLEEFELRKGEAKSSNSGA